MSTKENKELVREGCKGLGEIAGDISKVRSWYEKYCAPSYIYHHPLIGDMNLEKTIQYMAMFMSAFPDLNFSVDDILAEGDKTVIRYTLKGTHKGAFSGIPATGKQVVVKGVEIQKLLAGKVVEAWDFPNSLGMMTQLGAIPGAAPKT